MSDLILEAGGTTAFIFHVLFMLFNLFIIYQFYFNNSLIVALPALPDPPVTKIFFIKDYFNNFFMKNH